MSDRGSDPVDLCVDVRNVTDQCKRQKAAVGLCGVMND